jgi:SAM-dependent methyltransferase
LRPELIQILRCPGSEQSLDLADCIEENGKIKSGKLISADRRHSYPIRDFIPRFVGQSNYADNFGMQWNKFRKTQLDSYSGHLISAERFWTATSWQPEDMADQWVLDAGCGAGRFAEVAVKANARVVAMDYSGAVDACYANLRQHRGLHVVQGDICNLPFTRGAFPFVYSLGVLQHTPDVEKAATALFSMVAPGGRICIDFYEKSWKSAFLPKYWLRPATKRMSAKSLFSLLEFLVPKMLPLSVVLSKTPLVGHQIKRLIPVANYSDILPLNQAQQLEWSLLDTFDWLSPQFDNPQTAETVGRWLRDAGFEKVEVLKAGHLVGRARLGASAK